MKKLVIAGISLLAVGLLVLGSQVNAIGYQITQTSLKNYELVIETFGIQKFAPHHVNLTPKEYNDYHQAMDRLQENLNNAQSTLEARRIINQEIEVLSNYNLLPGNLDAKKAQQLLLDQEQKTKRNFDTSNNNFVIRNSYCFFTAKMSNIGAYFPHPLAFLLAYLLGFLHPGLEIPIAILWSLSLLPVGLYFVSNIFFWGDVKVNSVGMMGHFQNNYTNTALLYLNVFGFKIAELPTGGSYYSLPSWGDGYLIGFAGKIIEIKSFP